MDMVLYCLWLIHISLDVFQVPLEEPRLPSYSVMPYVKIHMTYYLKVINYYTVSLYRAVIRNVYVNAPPQEKWHMMLNNSMHGSSNEVL